MRTELAGLCEAYWAARCATFPFETSVLGDHGADELVPDLRAEAQATQAAAFRELAAQAEALATPAPGAPAPGVHPPGAPAPDALDGDERVTAALLAWEARAAADLLDEAAVEYTAAPAMNGPLVEVFERCPRVTLAEPAHAAALVVRYERLAPYFDTATERLVEGTRRGRPPPAHSTQATIEWLDAHLASDVADDPLLAPEAPPGWAPARAAAWRAAVRVAIESSVRPALQRYRDALAHEVLPRARPPEQPGLCWIDGDGGLYASAVRRCTTRHLDPAELHRLGAGEIERLGAEYAGVGARTLGTTDLRAIYRRLREDPALRFATGAEIVAAADAALVRAQTAVPAWFGRLPATPCEVRPTPAHEAPQGTIAEYQPPATDGTRPGVYYVNTHAPRTRRRFEAEALAFHEAVPGHHTQIALAQQLDVPTFRRHALVSAYTEGWAFYAERLADEMGLYSDDVARLGMLGFDSWRAGRLVVDTGLHHHGWTREQALGYLRDNSPLALNNIANEVDRYIVLPGQALSYKAGQRDIVALRRRAATRLGSRFDVARFHDALLRHGAVPLDLLARLVDDWVDEQRGA